MTVSLRRPAWSALAVFVAVVVADQVSKTVVLASADRLPVTVVGGLRLELVRNTGVSFSLFTGSGVVLVAVATVVVVLCALFLLLPRAYSLPLAILLGGSVSNLIDRARFDGSVIDFIAVYWWPRWNIADAAIVVGAVLLVVTVVRRPGGKHGSSAGEPSGGSPPPSDGCAPAGPRPPCGEKAPEDR